MHTRRSSSSPHQQPNHQFCRSTNAINAQRRFFSNSSNTLLQLSANASRHQRKMTIPLVGLFTMVNCYALKLLMNGEQLEHSHGLIYADGDDSSSEQRGEEENPASNENNRVEPIGKVRQSRKLYRLFRRYASHTLPDGTEVMTPDDFVQSIVIKDVPDRTVRTTQTDTLRLLFSAADEDNSGYISFNEFKLLVKMFTTPETEMELAFKMMDTERTGSISKEQFKRIMSRRNVPGEHTALHFNFDCELVDRFFGKNGTTRLTYDQFAHFMRAIHEEMRRQQFQRLDKEGSGYISAQDFARCVTGLVSDAAIPEHIRQNIGLLGKSTERVSYAEFDAFNRTVSNIEAITIALKSAGMASLDGSIDRVAFAQAARAATGITLSPIEVGIIFKLFSKDGDDAKLTKQDYEEFFSYMNDDVERRRRLLDMWVDDRASATGEELSTYDRFVNGLFKFAVKVVYGGIAGAVGATFVYPIDLVKTRMQNQRSGTKRLYKNSWDCFRQVWKHEGFLGFYRGLGPQLMGVGPEKSIKLVVNDLLREMFGDDGSSDSVSLPLEIIAGCGAGASQVVFTNPVEIVKIRLQVAGEIARHTGKPPKGAVQICRDLGFRGLYKGASACFSRDIPFSGIYFPLYAYLKHRLKDEGQKNNTPMQLLVAGSLAGSVAASTTTPFDVIKTRLQVETMEGQRAYTGIMDATRSIWKEEGPRAFMKGCIPRVCRSSPQFGATLLVYELLHQAVAPPEVEHTESTPTGSTVAPNVPVSEEEQEAFRKAYASRVKSFTNIFKM